jgi:hydrogenase expression/formation protein HypE
MTTTEGASLVVTTDSHVVTPLSFPGGDIGRLAVAGTVNDLAAMGATDPLTLTCSIVVEAGTDRGVVEHALDSMADACDEAGCTVRTGDTKVMGNGEVDGVVINATGVGTVPAGDHLPDGGLSPGDAVVVSGTVGDHGIALLAAREGFEVGGGLESDVAPVNDLVEAAKDAGTVTAATDPTRGGLSTALNRLARSSEVGIDVEGAAVPVDDAVASTGELLGIDPFDVACEGVVVLGVASQDAYDVVRALHRRPDGQDAAVVGKATDTHAGRVVLDTGIGRRYLTEPSGERLPRIC